ncbi:hypothetical protein [Aquimarina sp. 2201CG14-23]|uniref:hypothetical protein n=1 Tax=Aquimarina mycalae TaxID=3040073 RepID=UPI002477D3B8|nr:hypothetical protein [Aquimarina sp. 2201CG14-23]MDH7447547.1 hypothetical protein [Aquimarina sp. 2201CG14-23]
MKKLFVFTLAMVCTLATAQELPDVTPISPEAASIAKYGQVPVGLFTGTPQINVPIYTFKSGSLTVPISLNYSSNGIRVDEYASSVGLGWNLSAGGVITRSVNGQRDENQYVPAKDVNLDSSVNQYNFVVAATGSGNNAVDTQPDIFSFNFNGYSGKFYLDDNSSSFWSRNVVFLEPSPLKVELLNVHPETHFKITDPSGVVYYFGGENAIEKFRYDATNQAGNPEIPASVASAWYLTKIIHTSGEEVLFSYQTGGSIYKNSISQSVTREDRLINYQGLPNYCAPGTSDTAYLNIAIGNFCYVSEISSSNSGKVLFTYSQKANMPDNFKKLDKVEIRDIHNTNIKSFDLTYLITEATGPINQDITQEEYYKKRFFLSSVLEKSNSGETDINPYVFEYDHPDELPSRFSYAQDYWGFYNGKNTNRNLIDQKSIDKISGNFVLYNALNDFEAADRSPSPDYTKKGILSRIIYPTKGSNSFSYEGHAYYGPVTIDPPNTVLRAEVNNPSVMSNSLEIHDVKYAHEGIVSFTANLDDFVGDINGGDNPLDFNIAEIRIYDITNGTPILQPIYFTSDINFWNPFTTPYGINSTNFNDNVIVKLEKDHDYRFEISLDSHYSMSHIQLSYKDAVPTVVQQNIPVGGLRIAEVNTLNGEGKTEFKKYHYGDLNCLDCDSGSVIARNIEPLITKSEKVFCHFTVFSGCVSVECGTTTLSSNTAFSLFGTQGYHIGYRNVIEGFGENFEGGAIEHQYEGDFSIEPNVAVLGEYIPGLPYSTFFGFGRELKKIWYAKEENQFIKIQEISNEYTHRSDLDKNTTVYSVRQRMIPVPEYTYVSDPENFTVENRWFEISQYTLKRQWHTMSKRISVNYGRNGENPITTTENFFYDNSQHLQQTRTETTNSKGRLIKTQMTYPQDIPIASRTIAEQKLVDLHQIALPIDVITSEKEGSATKTTSNVHTEYHDWGSNLILPKEVATSKKTNALDLRVTYNSYDSYGNPQEVSKANGAPIVYIWGYHHQYPVAKLENITYDEIQSYVADIQTKSDADIDRTIGNQGTEGALRQALDDLRNALPDDVMVSTYTYDPMVGVTSMTDPRGYTMYYEYDEHLRLQYVKDEDGKLISENTYHYKN